MKRFAIAMGLFANASTFSVLAQPALKGVTLTDTLTMGIVDADNRYPMQPGIPLISYSVNDALFNASNPSSSVQLQISTSFQKDDVIQWKITFTNRSKDTLQLHNVHPFSESAAPIIITGSGNHYLSRTHLFQWNRTPVNVIVPDNAWELGYASIPVTNDMSIAALTRRDRNSIQNGARRRFETVLYPGGSVTYNMYALTYEGAWQSGLTRIFQEKMLFDTERFTDTLYQRKDLQWIRHSYVMHLMYAWDKFYYDIADNKYHLDSFLTRGKKLYGGDDFVSIWPTWPTLGLDKRNQFDLFNDLPGGTKAMKQQATISRKLGTKFFICYNPWDESTNHRNHLDGLSNLIQATSADGVVLDTKAEAGSAFQHAADKVRSGVVMYSEGMAVPRDMEGIVSGRVHNALYYPPMLNLNKLIKPEFAIFRVAELFKEQIRREFATSFFNGYGTEINMMAPGQPSWVEEQYEFFGKTSRILRENTHNFVNRGYTPLIHTLADSIWVNAWSHEQKTIYTIYSIIPQGFKGPLIEVQPKEGFHFVDLWHHKMLQPTSKDTKWFMEANTDAFQFSDLGTNNEGAVDCIAQLPIILQAEVYGDELKLQCNKSEGEIRIWAGTPTYQKDPVVLPAANIHLNLSGIFGRYEGDIVIQYLKDGILFDETIVHIKPGTPRRISSVENTVLPKNKPARMTLIPSGNFVFNATNGDEFIGYPKEELGRTFKMPTFWMDSFPVTNKQFREFIIAAKYKAVDSANFLKLWVKGKIPEGQENFPVVYVSYEDAKAYAKWAGKRLPTEKEWQYAAQAGDGRAWPWDKDVEVKRRNEYVTETLTVVHLDGIDSSFANLGTGKAYAVGSYPKGANPFGLQDLVGCVWQLTNDLYIQGSHRYIMMKGGSFFKPSGSWWYVQGGPRELSYRQYLLRVSEGFERNETVGFRCVKDAE